MRILHVVHQYLPEHVGGTEVYTQTLARYQVQQEGHRAAVFYPSEQQSAQGLLESQDAGGVHVYGVPLGPRSRTQVFFSTFGQRAIDEALKQVLDREKPDLVHVQHLMGLPTSLLAHFRRAGLPLVITLHDYWFPCANGQLLTNYDNTVCDGPRWWINCGRCALARAGLGDRPALAPAVAPLLGYRSRRLRQILAQADRVVAPTRFVRDTYAELNMPVEKMIVVPHGIEVPQHVLDADPATRSPYPGHPLHVVYVGSLARQKGLHVLVEAMNRLPEDGVRLSIFGDLETFPDYVQQLRAAARHPGIRFAGRIGRDAFWRTLLQEADVAVLPTLWYEASPLTIQEMFAARVPLVASDVGALPEKIRHGVDGLLFPPGDAAALARILRELYDDPDRLRSLRANVAPTHLMSDHVREVQMIYEEAMDG